MVGDHVKKVEITFKSGAQITVDADHVITDGLEGSIRQLNWLTPDGWTRRLRKIDLTEVVAIVEIAE